MNAQALLTASRPPAARLLPAVALAIGSLLGAPPARAMVTVTVGPGTGDYATLRDAFAAVNAGTLTGDIVIDVTGDTAETATATLNASGSGLASYSSIRVQPAGGAARTISGAMPAGSPLIDLAGVDNVTIDGLDADGNALTLSNTTVSATPGTSTLRFVDGATGNTVTHATLLGSYSGPASGGGGTVLFGTDAVTANGNDGNTVSSCRLGPAGTDLPTTAVSIIGSTATRALFNSGIRIVDSEIHDYFGAATTSAGIHCGAGATDATFSGNRFYQTAKRTQTAGAWHSAIRVAAPSGSGFQVSGNTIGFASAATTGSYALGMVAGSRFVPIALEVGTAAATSVQGNTIAGIAMDGTGEGIAGSDPFVGILVAGGLVNVGDVTGNSIGSQSATGSITYTSESFNASTVVGIDCTGSSWTVANSKIGGITAGNDGAAANIHGIRYSSTGPASPTVRANTIGGSVANSLRSTGTFTLSQVIGIHSLTSNGTVTGNTVRNLTASGGSWSGTWTSVIGISFGSSADSLTLRQNTVHSLSTTASVPFGTVVTGIQISGGSSNLVARNLVHSLRASYYRDTVIGVNVDGGTTTYANNMIRLGTDVSGTSTPNTGIVGVEETAGTNSFYFNTVYLGGGTGIGGASTFAFQSTATTGRRDLRNNIFLNYRLGVADVNSDYAIQVEGTAPNPVGLTSNTNVLYAPTRSGATGLFNGVVRASLRDWQTATGQDANSIGWDVDFVRLPDGTVDLHIDTRFDTVVEGNGQPIAAVTDDFDGEPRSSLTPTDIGADAGNFTTIDRSAPVIAYTPLANTAGGIDRTLTATLTDATGVAGGGLSPRIYYRKGAAGSWASHACSLASGSARDGSWSCTIVVADLGGLTSGDVVWYYLIAQDTLGNLGSNPPFAWATDVNTVTLPPGSPLSFSVTRGFTGSYSVGAREKIRSLTNDRGLFDELDAGVVTGDLTIDLTSDLTGETGTFALNELVEEAPGGYTITIRPVGAPRTISGTGTSATLIKLNGADRVTIDGSLGGGGTDRSLTLTNPYPGASGSVIWLASTDFGNGATGNTVRNCVIAGNGPTTTLAGIVSSGSTLGGVAEAPNPGNSYLGNAISAAQYGVVLVGPAGNETGNLVRDNLIGSTVAAAKIGLNGIALLQQAAAEVSGNTVAGVVSASSSTASGIRVAGSANGILVARNRVSDVKNTSPVGSGSNGIQLESSSTGAGVTVAGNLVRDVASYGSAGVGVSGNGWGIVAASGSGYAIVDNSVSLTTDQTASGSITAAVNVASGITTPGSIDLRNNALSNQQTVGTRYAVYSAAPASVFSAVDANAYWAQNVGYLGGDRTTLADWQAATAQDAASLAVDPHFRSATDLHLLGTSPLLGAGTPIAGITTDLDGDPRPASAPDIGADEVVQSVAGSIPAGSYYNALAAAGDTLGGAVTVTDELTLTGVAGTGASTLTLGCGATVTGAGAASYLTGAVKRTFCAAAAGSFPVGTATGYSPVDANVTAGTFPASLTVTAVQGPQPAAVPSSKALQRYWTLAGTGLTTDLGFSYLAADVPVTANEASFVIFKFNGGTYVKPGGTVTPATHRAAITGVTSFSDWTVADATTTPVELMGFEVE